MCYSYKSFPQILKHVNSKNETKQTGEERKRGASVERSKAGTKKNPDVLSIARAYPAPLALQYGPMQAVDELPN